MYDQAGLGPAIFQLTFNEFPPSSTLIKCLHLQRWLFQNLFDPTKNPYCAVKCGDKVVKINISDDTMGCPKIRQTYPLRYYLIATCLFVLSTICSNFYFLYVIVNFDEFIQGPFY